jgi:hypothetical protein
LVRINYYSYIKHMRDRDVKEYKDEIGLLFSNDQSLSLIAICTGSYSDD